MTVMSHFAKTPHVWPKCVTCSRYITSDVGPQYCGRQVGRGISTQSIPFPNPSSGSISTWDNRVFNTPLHSVVRIAHSLPSALPCYARSALLAPLRSLRLWLADWWRTNRASFRVVCLQIIHFWYVRKMFNAIVVKVITWLLYNLLGICQGVGWSFMRNFWNFHRTFLKLYSLEIFRQVGWLAWFYF